ncbi:SDR family oxidoreductase [Ilumatobacter sp.]|uniref:SDR family oxidoreductase n=1 Tax=Ilumatobacter sp. TaxID=1967498 RepID=UPI003AF76A8C
MSSPRRILVVGGTGYVGGRLVPRLLDAGHEVRVLARRPVRAERFDWSDDVDLVQGDVLDRDSLDRAFTGCSAAYYLVHSMGSTDDFEETDQRAATNFRDAADAAGIERIVYLGGMGDDDDLSAHLSSRHEVGEILASGATPCTELRAAVIIGSGSLSFEMLRYLTEVLPVMTTPTWVRTRCQPIAIRDVLQYLVGVLDDADTVDRRLDIGGPDVLSYQEMMQIFAEEAGLRRRVIVPVPVLSPGLSSRWVGLVTPLPSAIARPLIDSLRHEVVMSDHTIDDVVPHDPIGFRAAVELALRRTRTEAVDTRWSDAGFTPADTIPGDPDWAGGATYDDHQTVSTTAAPLDLYRAFARIGGANGYYVANWAWRLRGVLDALIGGPGLRRGRRHPVDLRPGEALDFWRVSAVEVGRQLRLEAQMRVPGRAWLSWTIADADPDDGRIELHQIAEFAPRGLWGRAYWWAMLPFHWAIFARMARSITRHAETSATTSS